MQVETLVALPALSIRQPWASYVIAGLKSLELRDWSTSYRGWLWIHAGRTLDVEALATAGIASRDFRTGGLLGIARLVACAPIASAAQWQALRNEHRSPGTFTRGTYAWTFEDTVALDEKIDALGALRLYRLDDGTRAEIARQLAQTAAQAEFTDAVRAIPEPDATSLRGPSA